MTTTCVSYPYPLRIAPDQHRLADMTQTRWKSIPPTPLLGQRRERTGRRRDYVSNAGNTDTSQGTALSRCQPLDLAQFTPRLAPEGVPTHPPLVAPIAAPDVAAVVAAEAREKTCPGDKSLPGTYPTPDLSRPVDCLTERRLEVSNQHSDVTPTRNRYHFPTHPH
jgi:hypothetical protein